jgi:hypothetical protein
MPPNTINVTRPGKWGNPFKVTEICDIEWVMILYDGYIYRMLARNPDALEELRGKNLACFCPLDKPCHADVLLKLANPSSD